jgi:hypothetical protein
MDPPMPWVCHKNIPTKLVERSNLGTNMETVVLLRKEVVIEVN